MSKVRFQMFLEENQKIALEKLQKESKIPIAELIRKAIDKLIVDWKRKKMPPSDEITEQLISAAGVCTGGPKDLADKHDFYLYGKTHKK